MPRQAVLDRYFLEHRAALLDLAAFLDRLDRAQPDADDRNNQGLDYREAALHRAIDILTDSEGDRARRIQQVLSDPTEAPAATAKEVGPTNGAYAGGPNG
jgi:hypothetical protein